MSLVRRSEGEVGLVQLLLLPCCYLSGRSIPRSRGRRREAGLVQRLTSSVRDAILIGQRGSQEYIVPQR